MKRYTIYGFLKAALTVLAGLTVCCAATAVYLLVHHGNRLLAGISLLFGLTGAALLSFFQIRIQPSVKERKKSCQEFSNGKTMALKIEPSTRLFLAEEEKVLNRLNELIDREELLKTSNKQAEYLALQNQINPHFLYNTLEAMRGDALIGGMESLAGVAQALSAFFRYTISDMQFLVTVEEELENINNYFRIQKYRFGDNLRLEVNFQEDELSIRQLRIPKLTLQPIVENSVYHGLEAKVNRGSISITFDQTETHLFISIKDSGKGIPEKELQELNNSLNEILFKPKEKYEMHKEREKRNGHTGIALKNVSQRIKLLFGEEYGIYIFSTPGVGTNVKITLPGRESNAADI